MLKSTSSALSSLGFEPKRDQCGSKCVLITVQNMFIFNSVKKCSRGESRSVVK